VGQNCDRREREAKEGKETGRGKRQRGGEKREIAPPLLKS